MNTVHFSHWPPGLPYELSLPQTSVYANLQVSAMRYPDKTALVFYDRQITYRQLLAEVDALAGYLQQVCGIQRGDRVLLQMQNCPQFVIAFYAVLRADAVVVPANPMLLEKELCHLVTDSGARVAIIAQDMLPRILETGAGLRHALQVTYSDCISPVAQNVPSQIAEALVTIRDPRVQTWRDAIDAACEPSPHLAGPADYACLPYTSGTTGLPKGCIHAHRTMMYTAVANANWGALGSPDHVILAVLPLFHVNGMQICMNTAIYTGATLVLQPRWDRDVVAGLIARHRVSFWPSMPAMMIDFLSKPHLKECDLSSLKRVSGGGAPMPAPIAQRLLELTGLRYAEGYGLSETMATTHSNPLQRLRQQCLGIPVFGVDSRVVDPQTLKPLPPNQAGEILIHGPQVFEGYWQDEEKTRAAFVELEGKRFLRTGDVGYVDEDGFFFFTDRIKRMINAAGFKVWPAEVEAVLYRHPEISECCIVAAYDPYRGETVKALVVKKEGSELDAETLGVWAKANMAAYKVPRQVEFVDSLPKSGTGKVMWRQLQDRELRRQTGSARAAAPAQRVNDRQET